jgi:hypothetical protein
MAKPSEVRKEFRMFISKQFSDKTIVGVKFGTELMEDGADPVELFTKVYNSTMEDIKERVKNDPLILSIWKTLIKDINREKKIEEAEKSLNEE